MHSRASAFSSGLSSVKTLRKSCKFRFTDLVCTQPLRQFAAAGQQAFQQEVASVFRGDVVPPWAQGLNFIEQSLVNQRFVGTLVVVVIKRDHTAMDRILQDVVQHGFRPRLNSVWSR